MEQYVPEGGGQASAQLPQRHRFTYSASQPFGPDVGDLMSGASSGWSQREQGPFADATFNAFQQNRALPTSPMMAAQNAYQAVYYGSYNDSRGFEAQNPVAKDDSADEEVPFLGYPTEHFVRPAGASDVAQVQNAVSSPSRKSMYSEYFAVYSPDEAIEGHGSSSLHASSPNGLGSGHSFSIHAATFNSSSPPSASFNGSPTLQNNHVGLDFEIYPSRLDWSAVSDVSTQGTFSSRHSLYPQVQQMAPIVPMTSAHYPYFQHGLFPTGEQDFDQGPERLYRESQPRDQTRSPFDAQHNPAHSSGSFSAVSHQGNTYNTRTVASVAQRKLEDKILMDGKKAGLTYKNIREQIGTDIAESTLRGRYRSLTKERKDRVRKPMWTPKDMQLLRAAVSQELDRVDKNFPNADDSQRLLKVAWKRVSDYIVEHGGSYRFGNATCKKKWLESGGHY